MTHNKNLLIGVLIGGIVVGTTAVLLKKTHTKKFKKGFNKNYRMVKNRAEEFLNSINVNGRSLASNVNEQAADWAEKAKDFVEWIRDEVEILNEPENKNLRYGLITAGITIGLLATATVVMYARSDERDVENFMEKIGSQITTWKQVIKDILEVIECRAADAADKIQYVSKRMNNAFVNNTKHNGSTLNDVIDFASAGLQLWQDIKRR